MRHASFQAMSPAGLAVKAVTTEADRLVVVVRPTALDAACTDCGQRSAQVHSRYERRLLDLPSHGHAVHLHVQVRRFRCSNAGCPRRIFGEPLDEGIAPRGATRTSRLEGIVHHLGIALGGRPAARLPRRLMLPVSRDTLLRVMRRRALPPETQSASSASTISPGSGVSATARICATSNDAGSSTCLPDREAATVRPGWRPTLRLRGLARPRRRIWPCRDEGRPQAVQVADRWHLMENASAAFLEAVRRSMRPIRQALDRP